MALIKCPECGREVSDRAKACIHCGSPLGEPDYSLKIKTPKCEGAIVKVPFVFTNDVTGEVLAEAHQNQLITLKIDKPTTIRCRSRLVKDAILNYEPHENAKYTIVSRTDFWATHLEFLEVEVFDSD